MKLETLKAPNALPVGERLMKAEIYCVDGTDTAIDLTFENGEFFRIGKQGYSDFRILTTAKPKMISAWQVSAQLMNKRLEWVFEEKYLAEKHYKELSNHDHYSNEEIKEIQIPEDHNFSFEQDIPF